VAGIILLVAIIAAIALTLRKRSGVKTQNPARQVMVRREERIRMAHMSSEPRQDG
jgi:NADH-quinone oxidoreductase subunit J